MSVSGAAMSGAPWSTAGITGGVVAVGDFGWHVIGGSIGLGAASAALSLGVLAFFVVAAAGVLWRARNGAAGHPGAAVRWASVHPWRFAVFPAVVCAAVVFGLTVVLGGGIVGSVFSGLWHGVGAFALTGVAGTLARTATRQRES